MKLGQKVKCKGYLKKTGNFIQKIEDLPQDLYITLTNGNFEIETYVAIIKGHVKRLNFDEEVKTKEIVHKEFLGFVVRTEKVHLSIYVNSNTDYGDRVFETIYKNNLIDCYKVYYAFGKSRLVPCDLCEVEE